MSALIDQMTKEALARLRHSINTRAGIHAAKVRAGFADARQRLVPPEAISAKDEKPGVVT